MPLPQKIKNKDGTILYKVRIRRKGNKCITVTFPNKAKPREFIREYDDSLRVQKYLEAQEAKKHKLSDAIARYNQEDYLSNLETKKADTINSM